MNEPWISVSEAAETLGVAEPTVYNMVKRGDLTFRRPSPRRTQVLRCEVEERLRPQVMAS